VSTGKSTKLKFVCILACTLSWAGHAQAPVRDAGSISQRLDRIEHSLQNQGLLNMMQQLQSLQQEIKNLRGDIEVQNHTIEQLQQRQRALYTDIDQRLQRLESVGAGTATTMAPAPPDSGADTGNPPLQTLAPVESQVEPETTESGATPLNLSVTPAQPAQQQSMQTTVLTPMPATTTVLDPNINQNQAAADPGMARAAYDRAYSLLTQSQYEPAIKAFREYLAAYPNGEDADIAQYWLGEAFYVLHQFDQAIVEYKQLITNYPQSQKYTIALLKIGYCYQELGQLEQARKTLLDLEQRYPQTTASRLAAEHLKTINAALQQQTGSETQVAAPN
jgi:tol-pal system protein YbgF